MEGERGLPLRRPSYNIKTIYIYYINRVGIMSLKIQIDVGIMSLIIKQDVGIMSLMKIDVGIMSLMNDINN